MLIAASLPARLRGLLRRPGFEGEILIAPCGDIHTFGMKGPIDVAFLGRDGLVLASQQNLQPRRRLRCPGAHAVIERFSVPAASWYEPGQMVCLGVKSEEKGARYEDVPGL